MISGSPVQSSLVWRRPPCLSPPLSYPSRSPARRPTGALKRRSAYFPGPANQTCPLKHRRNYHLSLFCSLLPYCVGPKLASPHPVKSVSPASQTYLSHFPPTKGPQPVSPSARWIPRSDITPGQSGPISGGFPQPCRASVRAHACTARLLQDPPDPLPWRSRDRECRSASNLPVSCISCISCTS